MINCSKKIKFMPNSLKEKIANDLIKILDYAPSIETITFLISAVNQKLSTDIKSVDIGNFLRYVSSCEKNYKETGKTHYQAILKTGSPGKQYNVNQRHSIAFDMMINKDKIFAHFADIRPCAFLYAVEEFSQRKDVIMYRTIPAPQEVIQAAPTGCWAFALYHLIQIHYAGPENIYELFSKRAYTRTLSSTNKKFLVGWSKLPPNFICNAQSLRFLFRYVNEIAADDVTEDCVQLTANCCGLYGDFSFRDYLGWGFFSERSEDGDLKVRNGSIKIFQSQLADLGRRGLLQCKPRQLVNVVYNEWPNTKEVLLLSLDPEDAAPLISPLFDIMFYNYWLCEFLEKKTDLLRILSNRNVLKLMSSGRLDAKELFRYLFGLEVGSIGISEFHELMDENHLVNLRLKRVISKLPVLEHAENYSGLMNLDQLLR